MLGARNMSTSDAQKRAVAKYQNESTDLIRIRVPKGKKEEYQALAERAGAKSLTAYITSILEEKLKEEH
jgi:type IV pilus biogenesis protein CpaD/CtpE